MEDFSRYKRKSLIITGLGTFMGTLDASIINVSLPTISRDLGTTISMVGWVILSYSIAVFSLLMLFGALSEKKGFYFSYKYGYLIFLLGSVLCGLSINIYMLIISRVIQGVGAALLISIGPALITRSFPASERGRGLSVISMLVYAGLMLGPPMGGFLIALGGWRWIFFVNVPVSILGVYFTIRYIRNIPAIEPGKKIGAPGSISLSLGLLALMFALLMFSRGILDTTYSSGILLFSIILFGFFFYFENNPKTQLIGVSIFKNRHFIFAGGAMLLIFIALIAVTILMPFYLEQVKMYRPEQVGLFLMITPICGFFLAPAAGYLSDKFRASLIATLGAAIMIIGYYFIRQLNAQTSLTGIILPLVLIGIGMAIFSTPNTSSIMGSVTKYQLGSASGILATLRTLGITLGAGFAIGIFSYYKKMYIQDGMAEAKAFIKAYNSVYDITIFVLLLAVLFSLVRGNTKKSKPGLES